MQYLVLGANGYIGSYIYWQLKKDGFNVIGTSRRIGANDQLLLFDIQKNTIDSVTAGVKGDKKTAIICIAESNIDKCYEKYDYAYQINVVETKKLIDSLAEKGFQIVFFSSDSVFDGVNGCYTEESPTNPINKYGMMKAEMEQYLLENLPQVCIMRISKVVSALRWKQNVFAEWENKINDGKIRCISGNRLSFVSVYDIYQACRLAAEKNLRGLYNVVGDQTYSRAELARKFYKKIGAEKIEVCECDVSEFAFKDSRPLDLSMSNQKFRDMTAYQFMDMDAAIDWYLDKHGEV